MMLSKVDFSFPAHQANINQNHNKSKPGPCYQRDLNSLPCLFPPVEHSAGEADCYYFKILVNACEEMSYELQSKHLRK